MMESSGLAVLVLPPDGLETEVSYMWVNHVYMTVKGLEIKAPVSYPGWKYTVVKHHCQES